MKSKLIYLDWNVMKAIKNAYKNDEECKLIKIIEHLKKEYFFIYSVAHLGDLMKGYSNKTKFFVENDLKFINCFTSNYLGYNYMYYNIEKKQPKLIKGDAEFIFNEEYKNCQGVKNVQFPDFYDKFFNDFKTYKNLRDFQRKVVKNSNYSKDDFFKYIKIINSEEQLKKEFYQIFKLFIFETNHNYETLNLYDKINNSYFMLDYFDSMKEKINKKSYITNILNDAQHCYFATFARYFISEDKMVRKKSKLLYEKFDVGTSIMGIEELINKFSYVIK